MRALVLWKVWDSFGMWEVDGKKWPQSSSEGTVVKCHRKQHSSINMEYWVQEQEDKPHNPKSRSQTQSPKSSPRKIQKWNKIQSILLLSHVAQAGLPLTCNWEWPWTPNSLPLALQSWDDRHVLMCLLSNVVLIEKEQMNKKRVEI